MEDERQEREKCDIEIGLEDLGEDSHIDENTDLAMEDYVDEPIADDAWLEDYYRRRKENNERMAELNLRWNGSKAGTSW